MRSGARNAARFREKRARSRKLLRAPPLELRQAPSADLTLRAEVAPRKGSSFDTGPVPPGSPVQISLELAAGGAVKVVAEGPKSTSGIDGKKGGGTLRSTSTRRCPVA